MFPNTADTLLRSIVRAHEGSDYIDAEGYWESGSHASAALAHGLEARGYALVKRNIAGAEIGVKPTYKGFRFARRAWRRSELRLALADAERAMDAIPADLVNSNWIQDSCWRLRDAMRLGVPEVISERIANLRSNVAYFQAQRLEEQRRRQR